MYEIILSLEGDTNIFFLDIFQNKIIEIPET